MAAPAVIDTTRLRLQDVVTSGKGAKSIPIAHADGSAVVWQPSAMSVLWNPSAFNDAEATRQTICFVPTPEVCSSVESLDKWLTNAIALDSSRLLGKQLSADEVRKQYQSPLRTHESTGAKSLRVKLNTTGRSQVRCWDTFRKPREQPSSWTECSVTPRISIRSVWIMGASLGVTLELRDAMLDEAQTECPF